MSLEKFFCGESSAFLFVFWLSVFSSVWCFRLCLLVFCGAL